MARGRNEEPASDREFLDAVDRARSDFLLLANRRLNQLATGGVVRVPKFDRTGSPIRKHHKDCDGQSGCGCELEFVEKVLLPNPNVLMWQVDRIDPNPNGEPQLPGLPEAPELNSAEQIAEAAKYFEMYKEGVQILIDLGVRRSNCSKVQRTSTRRRRIPNPSPSPRPHRNPRPSLLRPKSSPFRKNSNPATSAPARSRHPSAATHAARSVPRATVTAPRPVRQYRTTDPKKPPRILPRNSQSCVKAAE